MFKTAFPFAMVALLAIGISFVAVRPVESFQGQNQSVSETFEYAQLVVQGDLAREGDQSLKVRWLQGDQLLTPNFVNIEAMNRALGRGRAGRPTLGNLLNSIGEQGWELVDVRSDMRQGVMEYWAFKRAIQ